VLYLFDSNHTLIHQLPVGHRIRHHSVCQLCPSQPDTPANEHFCIHDPAGNVVDRIPSFVGRVDCSCVEPECDHYREFVKAFGLVTLVTPHDGDDPILQ